MLGLFFAFWVDGGELLGYVENLVFVLSYSQPYPSPSLLDNVHQVGRRTIESILTVIDRIAGCYVFLDFSGDSHHPGPLLGTQVPSVFVGNIAMCRHFIRMLLSQLGEFCILFDGGGIELLPLLVDQVQNIFPPLLQRNRDVLIDLNNVDYLRSHVFEIREDRVALANIEGSIDHSVPLVVVDLDDVDAFFLNLHVHLESLPPKVDLQPQQPYVVSRF